MTQGGYGIRGEQSKGRRSLSLRAVESQSAMEYLMTYGWAILIIAVILGVLFSLGVFNPVNYAPKVPAGNCHVFRPNGPGTNFNVNLVGTCSGFLPQYVAYFNGQGYVSVSSNPVFSLTNQISISLWAYYSSGTNITNCPNLLAKGEQTSDSNYAIYIGSPSCIGGSNNVELQVYANVGGTWTDVSLPSSVEISPNTWYNVAWTYSTSGSGILYVDGVSQGNLTEKGTLYSNLDNLYIGNGLSGIFAGGSIANVQIYNASLNANEIQYLYNEGIGGAPVYLSHLVGWWPLNGDTKDYSGNGNDGNPYSLEFNGSWGSGYTAP